jgi:putative SOS response-associated peptidase YedK
MCGRFSLYEPASDLAARFGIDEVLAEELPSRWNVAPTQPVYAVATSRDGTIRRLRTVRWGLVPTWAKDPTIGNRFINARLESIETARPYRAAFERRRCLIPANGFYEWKRATGPGPKRAGQPFYACDPGGPPLALAGVWEIWYDAEDVPLRSCSIITTAATGELAAIHDRMPVIVEAADWERWLAPSALSANEVAALVVPEAAGRLVVRPVSTRVNSAANEGSDLIEEAAPAP